MHLRPLRATLGALLLAAHLAPAAAQSTRPRYVDPLEYFTTDAQFDAWFTLTTQLRQNFDDVCGDTFCEGDYSNIESLRLRCSVLQDSGRIGRCVWIFAASNEDIDRAFGRILVQTQDWECRLPIASDTGIDALMAALAGDSPLFAMLPGTQTTIYEGLGDCL